jgi:hypothetical protein
MSQDPRSAQHIHEAAAMHSFRMSARLCSVNTFQRVDQGRYHHRQAQGCHPGCPHDAETKPGPPPRGVTTIREKQENDRLRVMPLHWHRRLLPGTTR